MGPTASGKSLVAERIASMLNAQLISADAFQVYRGLTIGTNKPGNIRDYELVDFVDPELPFSAGQWVSLAREIVDNLWKKQQSAVVVGGTGLYIRALFEGWQDMSAADPDLREALSHKLHTLGLSALVEDLMRLDPASAEKIDLQNPRRVIRALERAHNPPKSDAKLLPPFQKLKLGIPVDIPRLNERITERAQAMIDAGWKEEVAHLMAKNVPETCQSMRAIGYHAVARWVIGQSTREQVVSDVVQQTVQYAKRQRTWMRSEPHLHWLQARGPIEQTSDALQEELESIFKASAD